MRRPDPAKISRYWLDRADDLLSGCLRDRDVLPARPVRSTCGSTDFMADEEGTIARIYELAGQPFDDAARDGDGRNSASSIRAAATAGCIYDAADLGLDREEIATRLSSYRRHFIDDAE